MYRDTSYGGRFWLDERAPRWTDWRGRQSYKYHIAGRRSGERGR